MKKLTPFLIWVMFLLYACVPVVQTSDEPFRTRIPFTPTLTPQPTERPTAVPTPTEIPDPTMPLGEVGKDKEGTYVKMENGDIARKIEYKNSAGEILYEGWAVEKTQKGGIPLLDIAEFNLIPTRLYVASDVLGGHGIASLTHIDNTKQSVGWNTIGGVVVPDLYDRKKIDISNQTESNKFWSMLVNGDATLPFITSTGKSAEGKLGPDTGFITIVVPYDSLVPAEGSGVSEWLDPYPNSRRSFRSTVLGVDIVGNTICLVGSQTPINELSDDLTRALALFCAANIINSEDQTTQGFPIVLQAYVQWADAKGDKKVPDIIIMRNP